MRNQCAGYPDSADNMQETVRLLVKQQAQLSAQRNRHSSPPARNGDDAQQRSTDVTLQKVE